MAEWYARVQKVKDKNEWDVFCPTCYARYGFEEESVAQTTADDINNVIHRLIRIARNAYKPKTRGANEQRKIKRPLQPPMDRIEGGDIVPSDAPA